MEDCFSAQHKEGSSAKQDQPHQLEHSHLLRLPQTDVSYNQKEFLSPNVSRSDRLSDIPTAANTTAKNAPNSHLVSYYFLVYLTSSPYTKIKVPQHFRIQKRDRKAADQVVYKFRPFRTTLTIKLPPDCTKMAQVRDRQTNRQTYKLSSLRPASLEISQMPPKSIRNPPGARGTEISYLGVVGNWGPQYSTEPQLRRLS